MMDPKCSVCKKCRLTPKACKQIMAITFISTGSLERKDTLYACSNGLAENNKGKKIHLGTVFKNKALALTEEGRKIRKIILNGEAHTLKEVRIILSKGLKGLEGLEKKLFVPNYHNLGGPIKIKI